MNRNFIKISVSIVALAIALVLCLVGCKVDDVAVDLDSVKDEISANKADAAKALEEAEAALEEKLATVQAAAKALEEKTIAMEAATKKFEEQTAVNNSDIAEKLAALSAELTSAKEAHAAAEAELAEAVAALSEISASADAELKAQIEAEIESVNKQSAKADSEIKASILAAETRLQSAIDAVAENLENAKLDLGNKITANSNKISEEVKALKAAIETTEAVLEAADKNNSSALKAEIELLKSSVNEAVATINSSIDALKVYVDMQILDVNTKLNAGDTALTNEITKLNDTLKDAKAALEEADADNKAALEALVATTENGLKDIISGVSAKLAEEIARVDAAIAAGDADLAGKLATLNSDLNNLIEANAVADAVADAELRADVDEKITAAKGEINNGINAVKQSLADAVAKLDFKDSEFAANISDINGRINAAEKLIDGNKTELANAIEIAKTVMQSKIDALKDTLDAEVKTLEDADTELAAQIKKVSELLDATKAAYSAADIALEGKLTEAVEAINKAINKLNERVDTEVAELNEAIANGDKDLAASIADLKTALDAAIGAYEAADIEVNGRLDAAIETINDTIENLETTLNNAVADLKANTEEDAKLATQIGNVNDALKTVEDAYIAADVEIGKKLDAAVAAINAAIDSLTSKVNTEVKNLTAKIESGEADLTTAIGGVQNALNNAISAYKAADETLKGELTSYIDGLVADLNTAVGNLRDDLNAEIELHKGTIADVTTLQELLNGIPAADGAPATVGALEKIEDALTRISAIETQLNTYKATTEEAVIAWKQIYKINKLWVKCAANYGDVLDEEGNAIPVEEVLAAAYSEAQLRLSRALNSADVEAAKDRFFKFIESVETENINELKTAYTLLLGVKAELEAAEPNITEIIEDLAAAKTVLDPKYTAQANLIVDGEVVDLNALYADLFDAYVAERTSVIVEELNAASAAMSAARQPADLEAVKERLDAANVWLAAFADASSAKVDELVARYNAIAQNTVKLAITFVNVSVKNAESIADIQAWNATIDQIVNIIADIDANTIIEDVVIEELSAGVVDVKKAMAEKTIAYINEAIDAADADALIAEGEGSIYADITTIETYINGKIAGDATLIAEIDALKTKRASTLVAIIDTMVGESDLTTLLDSTSTVNKYLDTDAALVIEKAAEADKAELTAALEAVKTKKVNAVVAFINANIAGADIEALIAEGDGTIDASITAIENYVNASLASDADLLASINASKKLRATALIGLIDTMVGESDGATLLDSTSTVNKYLDTDAALVINKADEADKAELTASLDETKVDKVTIIVSYINNAINNADEAGLIADGEGSIYADIEAVEVYVNANLASDADLLASINASKKLRASTLLGKLVAYIAGDVIVVTDITDPASTLNSNIASAITVIGQADLADQDALTATLNEIKNAEITKLHDFIEADIANTEITTADALDAAVDANIQTSEDMITALDSVATAEVIKRHNALKVAKTTREITFIDAAIAAEGLDDVALSAIGTLIGNVEADITALDAYTLLTVATEGVDVLKASLVACKDAAINEYIEIVVGEIAAVTDIADIATIDGRLAEANTAIAELNTYITNNSVIANITSAASYDNAVKARDAKYVELAAATVIGKMEAYYDNFTAIYADLTDTAVSPIADIRAEYNALIRAPEYGNANAAEVEALTAADISFATVEAQYAALETLVADAADVAVILDDAELDDVTGNETEFNLINNYKSARDAWVARLEALGFTATAENDATKATVRALINEAEFNTIETAFNEEVSARKEDAEAIIAAIETLDTELSAGYNITSIESINAAYKAMRRWEGHATDPNGVGFILAWVTDGAITQENLSNTLTGYATGYKNYINAAKAAWTACYTDTGVDKLVDGTEALNVYEDRLAAVQAWFTTYGPAVSQSYLNTIPVEIAGLDISSGLGTTEVQTEITRLEGELAEIIANAKAEAAAINGRIDALATDAITTEDADEIASIESAIAAYFANTAYGVNEVDPGEGYEIKKTELAAAKNDLVALQNELQAIKDEIAAFNPDLDYNKYPDTLGYADADTAEAKVAELSTNMTDFTAKNSGVDKFTAAEYQKLTDTTVAIAEFRRQAAFKEAKTTAIAQIEQAAANAKSGVSETAVDAEGINIHEKIDTEAAQLIKNVNEADIDSPDYTDPMSYVQSQGNGAAAKIQAIVNSAV